MRCDGKKDEDDMIVVGDENDVMMVRDKRKK